MKIIYPEEINEAFNIYKAYVEKYGESYEDMPKEVVAAHLKWLEYSDSFVDNLIRLDMLKPGDTFNEGDMNWIVTDEIGGGNGDLISCVCLETGELSIFDGDEMVNPVKLNMVLGE